MAGSGDDTIYGDAIFFDPANFPSGTEGAPSSFTFVNDGPIPVQLYWIDASGTPQPYGIVSAGSSTVQTTQSDHVWVIVDPETGEYLELIGNPADGTTYTFDSDGNDSVSGGAGSDTVFLEHGDDRFGDWSTEDGDDTVFGGAGADSINAGNGDDDVYGGTGNDTLIGASGNDTLFGGAGNDEFQITDDHETDIITGGEDAGGADFDLLNFSNFESTQGVTVTATNDEAGTYDFDGTIGAGSYTEIEGFSGTAFDDTFDLAADNGGTDVDAGAGDDNITTGSGDDVVDGGQGADTFNTGAGNDMLDLGQDGAGTPDGDRDIVILQDGFGDDVVSNFDVPTANGDGTFNGVDMFDVSGLSDGTLPVTVDDVTVTNDGSGNAVLTFPNGESVTMLGVAPSVADNPAWLTAVGIPLSLPRDGTVSGTVGDDLINTAYTGDPDGDRIDTADAIIVTHSSNDDLIEAGAGNDVIDTGIGADTVYAGSGNDLIFAGADGSADTVFGEDGDDTMFGFDGDDALFGGAGDDVLDGDGGDDSLYGGAGNDELIGDGGADLILGGAGNDTVYAGADNDTVFGGAGDDTIEGADGDDVIVGDTSGVTPTPTAGNGGQLFLDVANVAPQSETGVPGDAKVGDSVIFNNAGTLPDGTIISVRVTVASISDPDVTVDLTENQPGAPPARQRQWRCWKCGRNGSVQPRILRSGHGSAYRHKRSGYRHRYRQ